MNRATTSGIILSIPILAGKVEAWRRFVQELSGSRLNQYEASRQRLGITREKMALMENSFGATAVTTLEGPDVTRALGLLISSERPFDVWYRDRIYELHGVRLAGYAQFSMLTTPPRNQLVHFEWMSGPGEGSKLDAQPTNIGKEEQDEREDARKKNLP